MRDTCAEADSVPDKPTSGQTVRLHCRDRYVGSRLWSQTMKRITSLVAAIVWIAVPATAQIVEYYHTDALGSARAVTTRRES